MKAPLIRSALGTIAGFGGLMIAPSLPLAIPENRHFCHFLGIRLKQAFFPGFILDKS